MELSSPAPTRPSGHRLDGHLSAGQLSEASSIILLFQPRKRAPALHLQSAGELLGRAILSLLLHCADGKGGADDQSAPPNIAASILLCSDDR